MDQGVETKVVVCQHQLSVKVTALHVVCIFYQEFLLIRNHDLCSLSSSFTIWAVLFVLARLLTLSLSVLTVGFGLANTETQGFDLSAGNFNILFVR